MVVIVVVVVIVMVVAVVVSIVFGGDQGWWLQGIEGYTISISNSQKYCHYWDLYIRAIHDKLSQSVI